MFMTETIFSAVFNILSIYVAFRMVRLILTRKEKTVVPPSIVCFLIWAINWLIYYLFNSIFLTIASLFCGMFVATILLYDGTILKKIVSIILAIGLGTVSENIIWILFGGLEALQINAALGSLFSSFLNMILILILERFLHIKKEEYLSLKSYLNIVIIIAGSIVLGEILVELGGDDQSLVMVGLGIICLIDVSTYYIYDRINEAYLDKLERQSVKQRVEMYENQLDIMEQSQRNIRALHHDMKKHLFLIQSYLESEKYDEMQQYIANVNDYIKVPGQHIYTGNQEIDVITNYMVERAKRKGCNVKTQIQVPDIGFMEKIDLNILLGNLLDNALEAIERVAERYLYISMQYKKGVFVIKIHNSFDGKLVKDGTKYISRKKDLENHGLGLQNVDNIIEKYNGERKIETTESLFKISIMLYVEAVHV